MKSAMFAFLKGLGLYISLISNKNKLLQSQNELTELHYKLGKQALNDNLPVPESLGIDPEQFKKEFEKADQAYASLKEQKAGEIHHFKEEVKNIENELRMLNRELIVFKRDQNELRRRLKKKVAILNYKSNIQKKQKKQFTVLTLFKGKIDGNKTILELKDEVGELNQMISSLKEGIIEHTESITKANERLRKTHIQHEYNMNSLKKEIKSKEKNYLAYKSELKSTLIEIGKFNADKLEHLIPNKEHQTIITEQLSIYESNIDSINGSLHESRALRIKGFLQLILLLACLFLVLYFFA